MRVIFIDVLFCHHTTAFPHWQAGKQSFWRENIAFLRAKCYTESIHITAGGGRKRTGNCCLSLCLQVSCHCETSAHTGRGNPPDRGKMYRKVPERMGSPAIFGGNRYLVPFNRGIATPVCALVRNDSKNSTNTKLSNG